MSNERTPPLLCDSYRSTVASTGEVALSLGQGCGEEHGDRGSRGMITSSFSPVLVELDCESPVPGTRFEAGDELAVELACDDEADVDGHLAAESCRGPSFAPDRTHRVGSCFFLSSSSSPIAPISDSDSKGVKVLQISFGFADIRNRGWGCRVHRALSPFRAAPGPNLSTGKTGKASSCEGRFASSDLMPRVSDSVSVGD